MTNSLPDPQKGPGSRPLEESTSTPPRFSAAGMLLGTLFFAFSLTPSLVPRPVVFQGVVSGLSLTLGYAAGRLAQWIWSFLELPSPRPRHRRAAIVVLSASCAAVAVGFLVRATAWQNDLRALMGMDPVEDIRPLTVAGVALGLFALLHTAAWQFRKVALFFAQRLRPVFPRRLALLTGLALTGSLAWTLGNGVIFAWILRTLDASYRQIDAVLHPETAPPDNPLKTGSSASLVRWEDIGRQGRAFVSSGPSAEDLAAFLGTSAMEPLRVYVGLNAAETPRQRARLAVEELRRVGAFAREVLLLVTPTGTGWVDPAALDPLEFLHRGNIASVAVQYSYLPSPLALLSHGGYGVEAARALFEEVYQAWTLLPKEGRPKLYLFGLSLGAQLSDLSFSLYDILGDPIQGALWVGPPFRSPTWRHVTAERDPASPAWLPRFGDGSVVRFMNQWGMAEPPDKPWGPFRILYLQYGSDPFTFFATSAFYREPEWLRGARAPDVLPSLRWYPIVTMVQLAADMAVGAEAAPLGFGHNFSPAHYIDAWIALTEPSGWTPAEIRRLKQHFAGYRR